MSDEWPGTKGIGELAMTGTADCLVRENITSAAKVTIVYEIAIAKAHELLELLADGLWIDDLTC